MAKALNINIKGSSFALIPTKIERKKLYGWTELRALTPQGDVCRQAGLDSNGVTIVTKGATKVGLMCEDGCWMEKTELTPMHADGSPVQMVPSSFDEGINLGEKGSLEQLMDLIVTAVYQLSGDGSEALASALGEDIYTFPFSYRGGIEAATAFIITANGVPFILVGEPATFDFVGLDELATLDESDDNEEEIDDEDLDFGMM